MLFYSIFLLFIICVAGRYQVNGKYLSRDLALFFSFAFICIIAMIRFDVGFDYPTYWKSIYPKFDKVEVNRWELIPRYIGLFCYNFKCPSLFFMVTSLITYIFVFFAIKKSSVSFFESTVIYISLFFLESTGIIREAMAVSITFWASRYIFDKKTIKFILACVFASFCHQSAFIAIPIYFLYNFFDLKKSLLVFIGIILLKSFIFSKFEALNLMSSYLNRLDELKGGNTIKIFYAVLTLYIFIMSIYLKTYKDIKRFLPVFIIGSVFPVLLGGHMGLRFSVYYNMYFLFCWPLAFRKLKIKYRAFNLCIFYLFFVFFLVISIKNPSRSAYIPYQTVIFADTNKFRLN